MTIYTKPIKNKCLNNSIIIILLMKTLTKSKIKMFMADEKKASKEYKQYGLKMLSRDEHSHQVFLKNKLRSIKS